MRKLIALILIAATSLSFSSCVVKRGDRLNWKYDNGSGELKISGTGQMYDFNNDDDYLSSPGSGYGKSVKTVSLSDDVTSIGSGAFEGFGSLETILIPESVTSIGEDAFKGCTKLAYTEYEGAKYLGAKDNPYYALITVSGRGITSCTVHPDTKLIADAAFAGCSALEKVEIPDGIRYVGERVFDRDDMLMYKHIDNSRYVGNENNPNLVLIRASATLDCKVAEGTKVIANGAFKERGVIDRVELPESLEIVGTEAFQFCESLKKITLHKSTVKICDDAFFGCTALARITFYGSESVWRTVEIGNGNAPLLKANISFVTVDPLIIIAAVAALIALLIAITVFIKKKRDKKYTEIFDADRGDSLRWKFYKKPKQSKPD